MTDLSLRDRKKHQTRTALVEAARALFAQRGFDGVTVDEIAASADVSPRTFFRYFGSKEAVLYGDQDEMLDLLREALASRPSDEPPLDALRTALIVITEHYAEHREDHLIRARLARTGAAVAAYQRTVLQPRWEDVLAEAIAERLGVDESVDPRPRLLAGVAIAVMTAAGTLWLASNGESDLITLLDEASEALREAVAQSRL